MFFNRYKMDNFLNGGDNEINEMFKNLVMSVSYVKVFLHF